MDTLYFWLFVVFAGVIVFFIARGVSLLIRLGLALLGAILVFLILLFATNLLSGEQVEAVQPTTTATATPEPVASSPNARTYELGTGTGQDGTAQAGCGGPISDRTDDLRVVLECDGRVWQPGFAEGKGPFQVTFTLPDNDPGGLGWQRTCKMINGNLYNGSQFVCGSTNTSTVTLQGGATYSYSGGNFNGGFALERP